MIWGFLPLSGARIKRELVQQTAEERCGIEFPSAWLGALGIYSVSTSCMNSLSF